MLISVIIPVYNVEKYLDRCLISVINQSYKNLEIIIVNDGSTDGSYLICLEYAKKDNRIKLFNKSNGGLSSARNYGIENSSGEYLAFIDSDDYVDCNMFYDMLFIINKHSAQIASCARLKVFGNGNIETQYNSLETKVFNRRCIIESFLLNKFFDASVCNKLFRKEIFSELRFPLFKTCEDLFIFPYIVNQIDSLVHTGKCYYHYDFRINSISNIEFNRSRLDLFEGILIIKNHFFNEVDRSIFDAFYFKYLIYLGYNILRSKSFKLFYNEYTDLKNVILSSINFKIFFYSLDFKRKVQFLFILFNLRFND